MSAQLTTVTAASRAERRELQPERSPVAARVRRGLEAIREHGDRLGVAHHVGPVVDEADVLVAARGQLARHALAEARLEPQAAVLLAPRAPEQPARRVDRLLHREAVVDDAGGERRLRLRLTLAPHRAVDELRPALADQH